jgi:hypothetical protein
LYPTKTEQKICVLERDTVKAEQEAESNRLPTTPCLRWYQPIHHKPRLGFQPADLVLGMSIKKENKLQ